VSEFEDSYNMMNEWRELVLRDRNHPSIIAWTPLNETWNYRLPARHLRFHSDIYDMTKSLDPTRPVNDASGYIHVKTDLWTVHHYERGEELRERLTAPETDDGIFHRHPDQESEYDGQPYLNDEFGGLKWIPEHLRDPDDESWGYGEEIKSEEEFFAILAEEIGIMRSIPKIKGWCYTQLTDVEQEKNGIYNYDRTPKFDIEKVARIFKSASEPKE
jgi:beta-galactosidase/beta-glucuronidase